MMNPRELAKQIICANADMDYLDYMETHEEELNLLTGEIQKAKELGLDCLLCALDMLTN